MRCAGAARQRRAGFGNQQRVAVNPAAGAASRIEVVRRDGRRLDGDVVRQPRVQSAEYRVWTVWRVRIERHHLPKRVDARVGASRRLDPRKFSGERLYCVFKLLLDRRRVLLVLEAAVIGPIVFYCQREAHDVLADQFHQRHVRGVALALAELVGAGVSALAVAVPLGEVVEDLADGFLAG